MNVIEKYENELKIFNGAVIVRSIHKDNDICFNSMNREILYSINECLKKYDKKLDPIYKESFLGKALIININKIPSKPPFNNLINNFKRNFFERLSLIENHYFNFDFKNLIKFKNKVKSENYYYFDGDDPYKISIKLNLPNNIISQIMTFVNFNYSSYSKLRYKYDKIAYFNT